MSPFEIPSGKEIPAQKIERREQPIQHVIRVFLFQSEDPNRLSEETPLSELTFTRTLFLKKGGKKNPGQLMPPGGKLEPNEDIKKAAVNEVVEETLLRFPPTSLRIFKDVAGEALNQDYSFRVHSEDKDKIYERWAFFARAKLLPAPLDLPYALDLEEDKIQSFETLSFSELQRLLRDGYIDRGAERMPLLDSLWRDKEQRQQVGTHTEQDIVEDIHRGILLEAQVLESAKKVSVLLHILKSHSHAVEILESLTRYAQLLRKIQSDQKDSILNKEELIERTYDEVQELWETEIHKFRIGFSEIQSALAASNFEEGITTIHYGFKREEVAREQGIPTLHLLFPLLLNDHLDENTLRVLKETPQTEKLYEMMRTLFLFSQYSKEKTPARERRLSALCGVPVGEPITAEHIMKLFYKKHWISNQPQEKIQKMSDEVNRFLDNIREEAGLANRRLQTDDNETLEIAIDQINEVKNASFEELCGYAFGNTQGKRFLPETERVLRWEAHRKLLLMLIYNEAISLYNEVRQRDIKPIRDIEELLETGSSSPGERSFSLGGKDYSVVISPRLKEESSLFRKMIVRDSMMPDIARDLFGEAIIFTGKENFTMGDLAKTEFNCCEYSVTRTGGYKLNTLRGPLVIVNLLKELLEHGSEKISIEDFKMFGDSKNITGRLNPGSTGKIRFWKFNIVHEEEDKKTREVVKRYREVQVFLPTPNMDPNPKADKFISPLKEEGDYIRKKRDDDLYRIFRLFDTTSLRSFMELLFPAEIYGNEIREMYRHRVSGRATKSIRHPNGS